MALFDGAVARGRFELVEHAGAYIQMMDLVGDHPRGGGEQRAGRAQGGQIGGDVGRARHTAPFVLGDPPPSLRHAREQGGE